MRRPLGGGMPFTLLDDDAAGGTPLTVFDTTDFLVPGTVARPGTEGQLFLLTLFIWPQNRSAPAVPQFPENGVDLSLVSSGDSVSLLQGSEASLNSLYTTSVLTGKSMLIADRLVLRGDQQVVLQVPAGSGGTGNPLSVYGYFEEAGEDPLPFPVRPLEPQGAAGLVAPFDAAPTELVVPATEVDFTSCHQLNPTYWDYVTLLASAVLDPTEGGGSIGGVVTPDGTPFFVPINVSSADRIQVRIFDGIPLLAPSETDLDIQIGGTGDDDVACTFVANGRFLRGT